jgi:hypothetical protein
MKPFAVTDAETDPFKAGRFPVPFTWGFYDGKRMDVWWGPKSTKQCFDRIKKFSGYVYAHNGGKFDFKYLLSLVPKDSKLFMIKGRIAKVAFNAVELRDSYLILPIPLKAAGKLEIEYWKFEAEHRERYKKEIIEYEKFDLYSLYHTIEEFVKDYGFGLTMAGRTFHQLKNKFEINPPKTNEHYDAKFRQFYYGGRVEFFELGICKGPLVIHDINSAYPFAMLAKHVFGTSFLSASVMPTKRAILQTCFVRFVGESRGGLPWRGEDGSLSFKPRTGEFSVTGWELCAALDLKTVRIDRVVICHRPLELMSFERYVNYFYRMKREAKKGSPEELFAKLFLNSAYGRFALNPREFKDVCMTPYGEEPEENLKWRKEGGAKMDADGVPEEDPPWDLANDFEDAGISIWEKPSKLIHNAFFNVATAASITGFVRAYLARALAGVRRPVYCDTDCIISGDASGLKVGPDLGDWKYEGKISGDFYVAGKKLYAGKLDSGKWKTACKGVRLSPEDIIRIAKGESVTSTLDAPTFSLLNGEGFVTRTVRRDDKRKRRKIGVAKAA